MMYVPLHLHSSLSPQWGVRSIEDICATAQKLGFISLALTDRNGLYGIPRFLECAKQYGLQPIIGCEVVHQKHRAIVIVRNADGYSNLCRLISALHCDRDFELPLSLQKYRRGMTILSDDEELMTVLRRQSVQHLYIELSPGHQMHRALALSKKLNLPPVATSRAVLLEPDDFEIHQLVRAIALNTTFSRLENTQTACDSDILYAPNRFHDFFPHCPQALENTHRIAASCQHEWNFSLVFPTFRGQSDEQAYQQLEARSRAGAQWRYKTITAIIEERLQKELHLIQTKGFAHYFLVVDELAQQCPRTCGRGSAAASLVAYCLGITHVDPIAHNLFFERFLNEGRQDPPDIDIDFPWDERDAILDFAFARYGSRRAAMVANQIGFKGRSAIREVAKVFGFPAAEIKHLTDRISGYWKADQSAAAVHSHPLFKGESFSPDWQRVLDLARRLKGQLRHLSLHCGGIVIVPDELRRYVPVEIAPKGLPVIQWEKDQAEQSGLVKIDILGNRSLAVIRDTLEAVKANTGTEIDYASWKPLLDLKTNEQIKSGETMGCFYIESPATRLLLKRMWKNNPCADQRDLFEHLVMASSIIRPAANRFVLEFLARMHGRPWQHLHPLLIDVLGETYGIAIYQEQITQISMVLAGFSASEGDQLRKIVSKKDKHQKLEDFRQKFLAGSLTNGVPKKVVDALWEQILSFAGYSFCKPHSASYALVSCKSAYLKANHPAEFMAAVISNQGGFYSPFAYLSEARRMQIEILPPDINGSEYHYSGYQRSLRIGLMQIIGLGQQAVRCLLDERKSSGPFVSFDDFLRRCHINHNDLKLLIKAGCFDQIEGLKKRPTLLWRVLNHRKTHHLGQISLFSTPAIELPKPPAYDEKVVLDQELETLGMIVSCHPLLFYRTEIMRLNPVKACDMKRWIGRYVMMIGWWITGKTVQDKNGRPMEFISFEDTSGIYDATFFPQAYARFCRKMVRHRPYILKGKIEEEFGMTTLTVEWIDFLPMPNDRKNLPERSENSNRRISNPLI